jgi:acid phosphatase (class A)
MKKTNVKFLAIFLIFLNSESFAKAYFAKETILPALLDAPFQANSKEWKAEVEQIIKLQKSFDKKEIAEAAQEFNLQPRSIAEFVDTNLNSKNYPKLYHLLNRTEETCEDISDNAKNYWHTKRPFLADKRVKALIRSSYSPAYPSGHTTAAYTQAHILGLLFPQKREEFEKRAEEIAWHRVLTGMHYPKDLLGGQQLSLLILGGLLQNADFQKDFAEVRKEIEKLQPLK